VQQIDDEAVLAVDRAVAFADASPFPEPESLYKDVYVLDSDVRGWYSAESAEERANRASGASDGEPFGEADASEIPEQLTRALAAREDGPEGTEGDM
jgi:hypothetical protein